MRPGAWHQDVSVPATCGGGYRRASSSSREAIVSPDQPSRVQLDGPHADAFGARQLLGLPVADEDRVAGLDPESVECEPVDPWIRLADAFDRREHDRVEPVREGRRVPQLSHLARAIADQAEQKVSRAQRVEQRESALDRNERPAGDLGPELSGARHGCRIEPERAEIGLEGSRPAAVALLHGRPALGRQPHRLDELSLSGIVVRPRGDRVPQIEDDCLRQALCTRTAVP